MTSYKEQIERIKGKLQQAKIADLKLEVFGADKHKYEMDAPATMQQVMAMEQQYGFTLPDSYKAFLLEIGNGGTSFRGSAAGPYYGIYKLGDDVTELVDEEYLKNDCIIYPGMTEDYWKLQMARLDAQGEDEISDDDYPAERGRVFGGILPIGSQGCTYLHGIILNGPHTGKVVNLSEDGFKPQFTYEDNFLDWYERWLDEVINGELIGESAAWFGYRIGGKETDIIQRFLDADSIPKKKEYLDGLLWRKSVSKATIEIVEREYFNSPTELKDVLLQFLTKHAYKKAKPILTELAAVRIGKVCELVHYYAKDYKADWALLASQYIHTIQDKEDFRFCTYILEERYGDRLLPFLEREDVDIRITAIYTLGKFKYRERYLDTFIKSLYDAENSVVHATIQALRDLHDTRLLPHYKKVAERYPEETHAILSNLDGRLYEYNLNHETIKDWQPSPAVEPKSRFSWLLPKRPGKKT